MQEVENLNPSNTASTDDVRRVRPRFGLKLLFLLLTVFAVGAAWLLQPQRVHSVTMDLTKFDKYREASLAAPAMVGLNMTTPNEDHCIQIRSPRIIDDAMKLSKRLRAFSSRRSRSPVEWLHDKIAVTPTDTGEIKITVVGDASDEGELKHAAETLAESYMNFLHYSFPNPGEITAQEAGWKVSWRD